MNERIAARVILLNEHNKVLFLAMHEQTYYWLTRGGGIEPSETLFETAKRELFEETGIENALVHPTPSWYSESILSYKGIPTLFKQYYFLGRVTNAVLSSDNLQEHEQNIKSYRWLSVEELKALPQKVYPQSLAAMLTDYFTHGVPSKCKTVNEV